VTKFTDHGRGARKQPAAIRQVVLCRYRSARWAWQTL